MSEYDEPVSQDQSSKYWKYRNELIALEQKSQAEYDRLVASLSGGALGVSLLLWTVSLVTIRRAYCGR